MKNVINGLVIFHILIFIIFIILLVRSFFITPQDQFRDQVQKMERQVQNQSQRKKQE
jgi:hypothetical protein